VFVFGIPVETKLQEAYSYRGWGILKCGAPKNFLWRAHHCNRGISDANLLGVGSFGKVYKGVLNDGTIIAVKLLNLENEGAHKSFDRECKVLGRVRHRNLIRIITSYSDLQIKALIFPLMPNGSLEKWLYPDDEVESSLTLIQRLNIAIDIAHGMAYLHHHCFMQVIHCDLKPNNVLLGEDMTAYLIDFGIATICFADSEDLALTSTHALKGSTGYIPPGII
jgi:serine/threonine protein kinase